MRFVAGILLVFSLALLTAQPVIVPAQAAFEIKNCQYCRRVWNDSPSRVRAFADANGRSKEIVVCSPFCLCGVLRDKPHYKLETAQVVLWNERSEVNAIMLNTESARFLTGVKDKRDLSHDPDIAAFRTDKQLGEAKSTLGGSTVGWDKIMEKCKKLVAKAEDEGEYDSDYHPLHHRKY